MNFSNLLRVVGKNVIVILEKNMFLDTLKVQVSAKIMNVPNFLVE